MLTGGVLGSGLECLSLLRCVKGYWQTCNGLHVTDARTKHWKSESACLYLARLPEQLNLSIFFGGGGGGGGNSCDLLW